MIKSIVPHGYEILDHHVVKHYVVIYSPWTTVNIGPYYWTLLIVMDHHQPVWTGSTEFSGWRQEPTNHCLEHGHQRWLDITGIIIIGDLQWWILVFHRGVKNGSLGGYIADAHRTSLSNWHDSTDRGHQSLVDGFSQQLLNWRQQPQWSAMPVQGLQSATVVRRPWGPVGRST